MRVDTALESGLALGRAALESQLAELDARARAITPELSNSPDGDSGCRPDPVAGGARVDRRHGVYRQRANHRLLDRQLGFFAAADSAPSVMNQLRITRGYSAVVDNDELTSGAKELELQLRVIVPLRGSDRPDAALGVASDQRWLQVMQPVPEKFARNASEVQSGYNDYQELALSRRSLRNLFGVTLTLAWLLAVFAAIAVGLYLSRRLVSPLLTLGMSGTHAVSVGDYRPLPESLGQDEVGQLTRSFNAMTRQSDEARRLVELSIAGQLNAPMSIWNRYFRICRRACWSSTNTSGSPPSTRARRPFWGRICVQSPGVPLRPWKDYLELSRIIRQAFSEHAAVGSERMHWQEQFEIVLRHEGPDGPSHARSPCWRAVLTCVWMWAWERVHGGL